MPQYLPAVERWRPLVEKYFAPDDVDKALHVIFYESSGNPGAQSDSGGFGLFQLNDGGLGEGLNKWERLNPETNVKTAAAAVYGGQGWAPWGENNSYQGQTFGALGNHPYQGSSGSLVHQNGTSYGSGSLVNGRAQTARATWANMPTSQKFGPTDEVRDSGYNGAPNFNKGWDFPMAVGTPIDATVGGVVIGAGRLGDGWGISVKVQDANGYVHNYGHLDGVNVEVGDTITPGMVVGLSGNSADDLGNGLTSSSGAHLSYDVHDPSGNWVDPSPWVSGGSVVNPNPPFPETEYLEKYTKYQTKKLEMERYLIPDPLTRQLPVMPAGLAEEVFGLEYEISEFDRWREESQGLGGLNDELARLGYLNQNNPGMIDAQNTANAWARQQQVNAQALSGTQNEMGEQRLTQDSANRETEAYRSASQFTAPMGFRVGATDLPTQEEVFAKQLDMASKNLPEVKPIPYSAPLSTNRGGTPYQPTPGIGNLPPNFGQPGYEVEGDIVDPARSSAFQSPAPPQASPITPGVPDARGFISPTLTNTPPLLPSIGSTGPMPGRFTNPLQPIQPDMSIAGQARGAGRRFIGSLFGRN